MPPDRAARPDAASSVAPIAICYRHSGERSSPHCLRTSIAPWRRTPFHQTLLALEQLFALLRLFPLFQLVEDVLGGGRLVRLAAPRVEHLALHVEGQMAVGLDHLHELPALRAELVQLVLGACFRA